MSKKLNWDAISTTNFDEKRRKSTGSLTGKELFAKAFDNLRKSEEALQRRRETEPLLRQALLKAMVTRETLIVRAPIKNPTESLGGLQKGEDDDGFYSGASNPHATHEALAKAEFQEVMETIPVGTELAFKAHDKQMGQFIFKASNGAEYAIYERGVVMFQGAQIENPGLFGLLYSTSLVDILEE